MSRSLKKGPYVDKKLYEKILKLGEEGKKRPIKVWARSCTIIPDMIGYTFNVYNGKEFIPVHISDSLVGHKLGEFSPTRTFRGHPNSGSKVKIR